MFNDDLQIVERGFNSAECVDYLNQYNNINDTDFLEEWSFENITRLIFHFIEFFFSKNF
jgi:hypothetical protein